MVSITFHTHTKTSSFALQFPHIMALGEVVTKPLGLHMHIEFVTILSTL